MSYASNDQAKLKKILEIGEYLNNTQDLDFLLERILYCARTSVFADAGSIYIREGNRLAIKYTQNCTLESRLGAGEKLTFTAFSFPINKSSISGYVAATGNVLNIPDMYDISPDEPYSFNKNTDDKSGYRTTSSITFPLITNQDEVLGVLQLINAMGSDGRVIPFSDEDSQFLQHFASTAVVALQRAKITRTILMRMISMAELRDPKETGHHVNRVASYAVVIFRRWAERRRWGRHQIDVQCDMLRMAAMLHDVGKVGIPDEILKTPMRYTDREITIMKRHSVIGAKLFTDKESTFDKLAQDVALRHHEHWDGSGYPGHDIDVEEGEILSPSSKGLQGDEIPIAARVTALADVFDALCSRRAYKEPWKDEEIFAEIKRCKGTHFDPEIVEIFFEILPTIEGIRERYKEMKEN